MVYGSTMGRALVLCLVAACAACGAASPSAPETLLESAQPETVGGETVWRVEGLDAPREGAVAWLVDEQGPFAEARVRTVEPVATGSWEGNDAPTAFRFVVAPIRALRGAPPGAIPAIVVVGPWDAAARARSVGPAGAASIALPAGAPPVRLASLVIDRDGDGSADRVEIDRVPTEGNPRRAAGGMVCFDVCRFAYERGSSGWALASKRCRPECQAITY